MGKYDALKLDNQLCFPLYAASREIIKIYHPYLSKLDLTYTQYITMMVLWEVKKITVKDLGKKLYLDSGTLTPLLKTLEKRGFITRKRSEKDERVLVVEITEEGDKFKDQAVNIPAEVGSCVKLSEKDAKDLYRILYGLLDNSL
ncbi:MAG: MarR family transcriptional regulator [Lachnospiraceae bacterium]|nr:MarR family transcriptional regulator [Lachnospiraceae bacterium]